MKMQRASESDDDGFGDVLGDDDAQCALQASEMAALARKMKTVGVREAIDHGKESALQEGFDDGFQAAARGAFRFGALRGALLVALASGLTRELAAEDTGVLQECIEALRVRSLQVPAVALTKAEAIVDGEAAVAPGETVAVESEKDDAALLQRAHAWAARLQLPVEGLVKEKAAAGES